MITGSLVGQFVEATDEVLEDQPHLDVVDFVWMKIDIAELGDDKIEDVGLTQLLDLVDKLEVLEDTTNVGGEAVDVADEVPVDVVGVAFELLKSERRGVVEAEILSKSRRAEHQRAVPSLHLVP